MAIRLGLALSFACVAGAAAAQTSSGQRLYDENCAACHQRAGLGVAGVAPALRGGGRVHGDPQALAALVLFGRGGMPGFKDSLTDAALADVTTYVNTAWGNKAKPMRPAQFAAARKSARPGRPTR